MESDVAACDSRRDCHRDQLHPAFIFSRSRLVPRRSILPEFLISLLVGLFSGGEVCAPLHGGLPNATGERIFTRFCLQSRRSDFRCRSGFC